MFVDTEKEQREAVNRRRADTQSPKEKMDNAKNNELQNTTQATYVRVTLIPLKTSGVPED